MIKETPMYITCDECGEEAIFNVTACVDKGARFGKDFLIEYGWTFRRGCSSCSGDFCARCSNQKFGVKAGE